MVRPNERLIKSDSEYEKKDIIGQTLWLMQYSEISQWLKHIFSMTHIDRYSFQQFMFKIPVAYDFTLMRYGG